MFFDAKTFGFEVQRAFDGLAAKINDDRADPAPELKIIGVNFMLAVGSIADSLQRIAAAQEAAVKMTQEDIAAIINEEVKAALAPAVDEEMKKRTERSFIGKKDA